MADHNPSRYRIMASSVLTCNKPGLPLFYSSALVSTTNQVYQSLAQLIRWSDQVLLRGTEEVNKENAHEVIKCVHDGVEVSSKSNVPECVQMVD